MPSGDGSLHIYTAKTDQNVGLGAVVQDMHITDTELLKMTARGAITVQRVGDGDMVVHSISRKYSTAPDSIIFGATFASYPSYSRYVVFSKYAEAGIDQVETKVHERDSTLTLP